MADYQNHPVYGRIGAFSPEGSQFLQTQFGDRWPDIRNQIAMARTGKGKGPTSQDVEGWDEKDAATQRLLLLLMSTMSDPNKRPGVGTPWANSWEPIREGLGVNPDIY